MRCIMRRALSRANVAQATQLKIVCARRDELGYGALRLMRAEAANNSRI